MFQSLHNTDIRRILVVLKQRGYSSINRRCNGTKLRVMFVTKNYVKELISSERKMRGGRAYWKFSVNVVDLDDDADPNGVYYRTSGYVDGPTHVEFGPECTVIGSAYSKDEFAEVVADHYNNNQDFSVEEKVETALGYTFYLANGDQVEISEVENDEGEEGFDYDGSLSTFDTPEDALDDYITSFTG